MKRILTFVAVTTVLLCSYSNASMLKLGSVTIPQTAGEIVSFDLVVDTTPAFPVQAFQSAISASGPGTLTLLAPYCENVANETSYWLSGNSDGVIVTTNVDGSISFSDTVSNGIAESMLGNEIVARYVFIWDGTVGDYTFTFDFSKSYALKNDFVTKHGLTFGPGKYAGNDQSFTFYVPEPASLALLVLGGFLIRKK